MAPKTKEHSSDLRILVIKHYQNDDSQREIASKTLLRRSIEMKPAYLVE